MALAPKHKVFLSHSGAQKGFVEQLNLDLKQRNRHAFFDKDRECLPIAKKFPPLIIDAIQQCEVGVVVLTDEFLSSKWPMVELVEMVRTMEGNKRMNIMPIFFGVSVEDLKDDEKMSNWRAKWQGLVESEEKKPGKKRDRIDILEWEDALRKLNPFNGLAYNWGIGEVQLRKEIVEAICKLVRPFLAWDDSRMQGKLRFIEVMEEKVKEMFSSITQDVRVVGLYGVGGIGKTTFCKLLCNHFEEEFCGRVCHVEFGKGTMLETLHMILRKLGNRTSEHLKDLSEDQCGEDLKNLIHCGKVFLAIDNISSDWKVMEEARRYLDTGYTSGSIVVVIARALGLLTTIGINAHDCLRMPELLEHEAMDLLLYHAKCKDVDDEIVSQCIQRSYFNRGDGYYHYLPLVLEVLGKHLRGSDPSTWVKNLELNPLRNSEHPVFHTLEISFGVLLQEDKDLFMDVAIFYAKSEYSFGLSGLFHWNVYESLRELHGLPNIDEVKKRLDILKTKSLLEEVDDCGNIGMHELWKEFALYMIEVGKEGRRWVCEHDLNNDLKESILIDGGWKVLERISIGVQISFCKNTRMLLSLKSCSNLKALRMQNVNLHELKDLESIGLSQLRIMEIYSSDIQIWSGLGQFQNLRVLKWSMIDLKSRYILEQIGLLTNLRILDLEIIEFHEGGSSPRALLATRIPELDLKNLRSLQVARIHNVEFTMLSLSSQLRVLDLFHCNELITCRGLEDVSGLEVLKLLWCEKLQTLLNLQKLKSLKVLNIRYNKLLTEVSGLENMVSLQELLAYECCRLQALPNMSKLTNLQRLYVSGCDMIDCIPGMSNLIALQKLKVDVKCLNDTPNIRKLMNLDEVSIYGGGVYDDHQGGVYDDHPLDLGILENAFGQLDLRFIDCELTNLHKLTRLKTLTMVACGFWWLPNMGNYMRLESLSISHCNYLRSWDGVGGLELMECYTNVKLQCNWTLAHLKELKLHCSPIQLPDLSHFPQLTKLILSCDMSHVSTISGFALYCENDHLKLEKLKIECWPIKKLPDLRRFPELMELSLSHMNQSLRSPAHESNFSGFALHCQNDHTKLKHLVIYECPICALPDLSKFSSLQTLEVQNCQNLTSLIANKPLTALGILRLRCCYNLKELPTISYMQGLRKFTLYECGVTLNRHECEELSLRCKFFLLN